MSNFFGRGDKPRQEWNPHWILKLLYGLWYACLSVVKVALGAVATVLLICVVCAFVFVGILGSYLESDILPEANYTLENGGINQTSYVYYVDNAGDIQVLQQINTSEDRQWASLEEMPQALIDAAVAIEDKRFYEHQGVDWITTVKACANMFFGGGDTFGGSTITQQLIKNRTRENSVTVQRKVMEIFRATQFERYYDKDTIMEWYLNTIYFGNNKYGVKSAAAHYFGKELRNLTAAECASLISITNNPSIYGPYSSTFEWTYKDETREYTGAERNKIRQENTLWSMKQEGFLTEEEYEAAIAQELVFKSGIDDADKWTVCKNSQCGYEGVASSFTKSGEYYYCPQCGSQISVATDSSQEVYSYFVDTVIEDVARVLAAREGVDFDTLDKAGRRYWMDYIQLGGYHIFSTLDMEVQNAIDEVYTDLSQIPTTRSNQQLQSGIVVIDNRTGDIVGMAGGVGEKTVHDGFNRATDSLLQTGSSQKPLSVYAPAFEVGAIAPSTMVLDMPVSYSGGAFPKNDNRTYSFSRTIYDGIRNSVNAVAVQTLRMIGYDYSYSFAKEKFRLSTLTDHYESPSGKIMTDLGDSPLGMGALTVGATVRDMSAAYATFANNGVYRQARTFTKVYDSAGNLVIDNVQETEQILSEKTVNYMNYCLQAAVESGTGSAADFSGQNIAGKTGTTSSNRDRWFCGYTGYYTAAIWCGYDQPEQIRLTGSSSNPACRLFKKVMQPLHSGKDRVSLYSTSGMRSYSVCLDSGMAPNDACSKDLRNYLHGTDRVASAYSYKGDGPSGTCDQHVLVDYCTTGGGVCTEYCRKFAEVETVKIDSRALLKLTPEQVEELQAADNKGLKDTYTDNRYVYYVSESGKDLDWHGFDGRANKNVDAPYVVCPVHTKEAWEAYEAAQATEPPTEPELPEDTPGAEETESAE